MNAVKDVRWSADALRDLRRHATVAERIRAKVRAYAGGQSADVRPMRTGGMRMRVGDYRVLFEETETSILVTRLGPRASVYGDD